MTFKSDWTHLDNMLLADPQFNSPGRIDLLLGVDIYVESLLHGRRTGPPGSPVALKIIFGWVLAGKTSSNNSCHVTSHHVSTSLTDDDILSRFWEIEELTPNKSSPSIEDQSVLNHFKNTHCQNQKGRFIVPLPRRTNVGPLRDSRSQAVRRFMMLERSLLRKDQHAQMDSVMREYLDLGHAEQVPVEDLKKPPNEVFYFPIHAVYKTSSTTTKVRAVFDASAKSTTGVSLNDCLLVGPTVHSSLIDVLLRFRLHRIAITTDPRRFKTYVGNRVAQIISEIPSERWKHVTGTDNPADCASRGLYPSELIHHQLWWNGPTWLMSNPANWPNQATLLLIMM